MTPHACADTNPESWLANDKLLCRMVNLSCIPRSAELSVQVGGDAWNAQQDALQRLAAHMHASVAAGSNELGKEALVRHGKLDVLVHLLLVFEVMNAWTQPMKLDC